MRIVSNRVLKFASLTLSGVLLLGAFLWPSKPSGFSAVAKSMSSGKALGIIYEGLTRKNERFVLEAQEGQELTSDRYQFTQAILSFYQGQHKILTVQANYAVMDRAKEHILLKGQVSGFGPKGMRFTTEAASIYYPMEQIQGVDPISVFNVQQSMCLYAKGFKMFYGQDNPRMLFSGHPKVHLTKQSFPIL